MSIRLQRRLPSLLLAFALTPLAAAAPALTLAGAMKQPPAAIVYQLPDTDGRDQAVSYVQLIRKNLAPQAALLDASSPIPNLPEKLKSGFLLITTLTADSKLLRAATARLGWTVDSANFHWRDITTPLASVMLVITVKNPYGDGPCLILAAGSNRALAGPRNNSGSSSFYIYRDSELLREVTYDENFTLKTGLTKPEALADVDQFFSTLERIHPNLLAKVTRDDYRKLQKRTRDSIHDTVTTEELAYALYYAAAYFKDGHTSVQWTPDFSLAATRRFPSFRLTYENDRFRIPVARDPILDGAELLAINGTPINAFLRPILDRCSGETVIFRVSRFLAQETMWYYLTNLFGSAPAFQLKFRDSAGIERETQLATLTLDDYQTFRDSTAARLTRPNQRGTAVEFLGEGEGAIAHFSYQAFQLSDAEKKKVDDVFRQIRRKRSRELIIDLRGNGGGNSSMGDYIFSYLYDRPFRAFSKVEIKEKGKVTLYEPPERAIPKPEDFFSGRIFLLVDNGTFSSAADFAAMFRDYKIGTILGSETGGLPVCFGDVSSFTLNNSGIQCGVSFKRFWGPKPRPGDDQHGVLPDIPLDSQSLASFHTAADPALAYTEKHIRQQH